MKRKPSPSRREKTRRTSIPPRRSGAGAFGPDCRIRLGLGYYGFMPVTRSRTLATYALNAVRFFSSWLTQPLARRSAMAQALAFGQGVERGRQWAVRRAPVRVVFFSQ